MHDMKQNFETIQNQQNKQKETMELLQSQQTQTMEQLQRQLSGFKTCITVIFYAVSSIKKSFAFFPILFTWRPENLSVRSLWSFVYAILFLFIISLCPNSQCIVIPFLAGNWSKAMTSPTSLHSWTRNGRITETDSPMIMERKYSRIIIALFTLSENQGSLSLGWNRRIQFMIMIMTYSGCKLINRG